QHRLTLIVEVRWNHERSCMFQSQPALDVLKSSAYSESGGGKHCAIQALKKRLPQNLRYVDGRSLQRHETWAGACAPQTTATFDPENGIAVRRFKNERQMNLEF